jgi:hypothetical protein
MPRGDGNRTARRWQAVDPEHQLPPGPTAGGSAEPGLMELVRSLADDLGTLVRQEIELARMEVTRTVRQTVADGVWMATGVAVAAVGALCLVLAMALGLGALLGSYWLGTLITGLALVLVGGAFLLKGLRNLRKREFLPIRTTESLREDARWARDEAREFKEGLTRE